jgi:hypothetical protein
MSLDLAALIDPVTSHASASGMFDAVQAHEPKSPPGTGLTYAVFVASIGPARGGSGLAATSARVELTGRIYKPFLAEPEDLIDPNLTDALDRLFTAYAGDFDLGANVRCIDLLGAYGNPLGGQAGYQSIDRIVFRVFDITIPLIVNDAWAQVA